jgi:type III secretion protein U
MKLCYRLLLQKVKNYMAAVMKETAEKEGIPVVKQVGLTRGLYAAVPENNYITSDFFCSGG